MKNLSSSTIHSVHLNFSAEWNNWYIYDKLDILTSKIKRSPDLSDSQELMVSRKRRSLSGKNADSVQTCILLIMVLFFSSLQMVKVLIYPWPTLQRMVFVIITYLWVFLFSCIGNIRTQSLFYWLRFLVSN